MKIAVFGFDVAEAAQIRRIRAFRELGHDVVSYTMRRKSMNQDFQPEWENVHLYETQNENHLRRLSVLLRSIVKLWPHRHDVCNSDVVVARNFDMLALAWTTQVMGRKKVPTVYECLDIHALFVREDRIGAWMRKAEKFLLDRVDVTIISSPGFESHYFAPTQDYDGPFSLLENKLWFDGETPDRPDVRNAPTPVLRLGWVGTIRCKPSFQILLQAARELPKQVQIEIHGVVHRHVVDDFDARVDALPNVTYHGAYEYPKGLEEVYGGCDLVWAQDLWQQGANSDWLLPNRIYEAAWHGCPAIALSTTETGRKIQRENLGYTVDDASPEALVALLHQLSPAQVSAKSKDILAQPSAQFQLLPQDIEGMLQMAVEQS